MANTFPDMSKLRPDMTNLFPNVANRTPDMTNFHSGKTLTRAIAEAWTRCAAGKMVPDRDAVAKGRPQGR